MLGAWVGAGKAFAQQEKGVFEFGAGFDFYYLHSPQAQPPAGTGPSTVIGRSSDSKSGVMALNLAEISVRRRSGKLALQADLGFGEMADTLAGSTSAPNEPTRNILQAFAGYDACPGTQVSAGKYFSYFGFESPKAKDNWQYSRGFGDVASPEWFTGAFVTRAIIPERLTGSFHLLNGWSGRLANESNRSPAFGLSMKSTLEKFGFDYNYFGGIEPGTLTTVGTTTTATTSGWREMHEITATYNPSKDWNFALNAIYGYQKNATLTNHAKWSDLALYMKAQLTPWYSLSPRLSLFDDSDQGYALAGAFGTAAPLSQKLTSMTLTNAFDLGDGLETRIEIRADRSSASGYFKNPDGTGTDHQESYTLAFLYAM